MKEKVKGPAIGLIVAGGLGVAMALLNILSVFFGAAMSFNQYQSLQGQLGAAYYAVMGVSIVLGLGVSGFLIWAGLQMKELRNRTLCIVACILAMIPCLACCLVGLPVGIWGLVVLMNDEVKQAFTS